MKTGLAVVPPMVFAGTRFLAAGALLIAIAAYAGVPMAIRRSDAAHFTAATVLMVALTYPFLFWGAIHVSSGLAAVLDLSFIPVALLVFGVLSGEERFSRRRTGAVLIGVGGLAILFGPKAIGSGQGDPMELWGGGAILLSAIMYAAGSVISRPLLRAYPAIYVSGITLFCGGVVVTIASVLFEAGAAEALSFRWGAAAWISWLFLVFGGSIAAYTIYLRLVRDWGPSRAGAYCFVSPAIAVAFGAALLGERLGVIDLVGMAVMVTAAWLAVGSAQTTADGVIRVDIRLPDQDRRPPCPRRDRRVS